MGHVTDGGLEPEPGASIKGQGRPVNWVLALFGANFRYFPANFRIEDAARGGMAGIVLSPRAGGGTTPDGCGVARWLGRGTVAPPQVRFRLAPE